MNTSDEMKFVVSFSGNGFVFAVLEIGGKFLVAVRKYHSGNGGYQVVDTVSCDDEQDARHQAFWMGMPDGYKGI